MGKTINQLRAGAALSYVNLFLSFLIPLFYTPVMLRILGQSEYGLFSLASSVIGYLSLLSFGFGSAIIRYVSLYRATGERDKEENIFGFFLILYAILALVVLLFGVIVSMNVEHIFHRGLSASEIKKMQVLTLIMSFNTALSFPLSVFSSVIFAHERYIFRRILEMFLTVIVPLGNLIALYMGFASVGMAVSSTIVQIVTFPVSVIYCFKVMGVRPRMAMIPAELMKEIIGFSFFVFLATIVDILFWSTDKVILGMLAGSTAVAVYNIGGTFNSIVTNLSTSISSVLTPRVTGMVAKNKDKEDFSELFIRVGRLQFLIVALVLSGFAVFGKTFIFLWAGPEYSQSFWIAIITLFPLSIPLIQNTGISIVIAQNKHQFRSVVYLVLAIINVIATYAVVPYWGVLGAAGCSAAAYCIGQGIIMNIYYYKVTGLNIVAFWKNILGMAIIPVLMLGCGLFILSYFSIHSWVAFFIGVITYSLIYCVLMYGLVMNDWEKSIITDALSVINRFRH